MKLLTKLLKKKRSGKNGLKTVDNLRLSKGKFSSSHRIRNRLKISNSDIQSGAHKIQLYRFLTNRIPAVSSCLWTWTRLSAATSTYKVTSENNNNNSNETKRAELLLGKLAGQLYLSKTNSRVGLTSFLTNIFMSMYRDGFFTGVVTVKQDSSGIDEFILLDPLELNIEKKSDRLLFYAETDNGKIRLDGDDFYHAPLDISSNEPLGESILHSIPFVSFIEQQLVDDMRRASHNAGFHRLHVRLTPPERFTGESEKGYVKRINNYFDDSVDMIKSLEVDDNPVTWDNVEISHISPRENRGVTNSWFMHHRAMIEEICAGTNLAPFLLGYSFGATTTWANFKFDMVMRQVRSVQSQVSHFMEWLGNIELALAGYDLKCKFEFDNSFSYQASEAATVQSNQVDSVLKLYNAGLISQETAKEKAEKLV